MEIKASLESRMSKKGNLYQCLVIKLTPTYEKIVLLERAEIELLNAKNSR